MQMDMYISRGGEREVATHYSGQTCKADHPAPETALKTNVGAILSPIRSSIGFWVGSTGGSPGYLQKRVRTT